MHLRQGCTWRSDTVAFPFPEYIQFYPTTLCNQRCSFCFNRKSSAGQSVSFRSALSLLDILTEKRIRDLDIMGGEPFLLPWMADLVRTALAQGISVNISTNGSMPEIVDRFRGLDHEHFNIGISLEGSTAEAHNTLIGSDHFRNALLSIKKLVDLSLDPIVKTVLNRETAGDIQNIVNLIRDIGVRRYYIIQMDVIGPSALIGQISMPFPAFRDFHEKIRTANPDIEIFRVNASCFDKTTLPPGMRCAGGVRKLSVLPDGTVFPCNLFHTREGFALGNIFKDSLADIWADPRLDRFRHHRENSCTITGCDNHASCTGGCPAHGYYHGGDLGGADMRCIPDHLSATDNPHR